MDDKKQEALRNGGVYEHKGIDAKPEASRSAWAVFDPNWGEPVPLLSTIRASEAEAIDAALLTNERGASLYHGGSTLCAPPVKGLWENMQKHGYTVRRVALSPEASHE
jgi:hypothetical protein